MTKRPGARVHGPNCQSNNLFGEEERSAQRKYDRRVEVASRRGCLIIESRAIVRIVVLRNLCQRSLLCHFLCHHVNHCHFMDIFFLCGYGRTNFDTSVAAVSRQPYYGIQYQATAL